MEYDVRPARPGDLAGLPSIEDSGDRLFQAQDGLLHSRHRRSSRKKASTLRAA